MRKDTKYRFFVDGEMIYLQWHEICNCEPINISTLSEKMESIGLKDKSAIEIYEGDVCVMKDGFEGVVEYQPQCAGYILRNLGTNRIATITQSSMTGSEEGIMLIDIEVKGNIYSRPDYPINY